MDVAAFIISIFALVFALIGMGLAMRALYIIGVNAGLAKQFEEMPNPTPAAVNIKKEFKKPLRVEGNKVIYNEDPLDVAMTFEDFGLKYLHLVDLDGAKARKIMVVLN